MAVSSFAPKATASRVVRGIARNRKVRAIKARLAGLVDTLSDWLNPGWPGVELQPIRVRASRRRG